MNLIQFANKFFNSFLTNKEVEITTTTIDIQVKEKGLKPPFLIKLDTHGFEVPILNGAEKTLTMTNLLILETYNFNITKDCLLFYQMCAHLESKGFRCIDLCSPVDPKMELFGNVISFLYLPIEGNLNRILMSERICDGSLLCGIFIVFLFWRKDLKIAIYYLYK